MCAMCGCNSQEFMGVTLNAPDAQNIDGIPQKLDASNGFGSVLDSKNNLGVDGTIDLQTSQSGN